jgi:hypothetical protein
MWKKPVKKDIMLHDSTYMKLHWYEMSRKGKLCGDRSGSLLACSLGEGEEGNGD